MFRSRNFSYGSLIIFREQVGNRELFNKWINNSSNISTEEVSFFLREIKDNSNQGLIKVAKGLLSTKKAQFVIIERLEQIDKVFFQLVYFN